LVPTVGRTHVWRTLGTGNLSEALRQARIVAYEVEVTFRGAAEHRTNGAPVAVEVPADSRRSQSASPPEKTLRQLLAAFIAAPTKVRSTKTQTIYENAVAIAGEVLGLDAPLRSIERESCRRLLDMLRWLPSNAAKRFPRLSALQASEMAGAKGLTSTLSQASANGYMNRLSALRNFAVNEGYIDRYPARGLRIANTKHRRDRRLPFSNDQLWSIFNAPLYWGCLDDGYGYAQAGTLLGTAHRPL